MIFARGMHTIARIRFCHGTNGKSGARLLHATGGDYAGAHRAGQKI